MNEFDLRKGATVYCQDGKCGKLSKIAVEPDSWRVTELIVEEGLLLKKGRVFPFSTVVKQVEGDIHLDLLEDDLAEYPEYKEDVVEEPAPGYVEGGSRAQHRGLSSETSVQPVPMIRKKIRQGVTSTLFVIERGIPIKNLDETLGKLDHVLAEPESGHITDVVLQKGLLFTEQRLLPISQVEDLDEHAILVKTSEEDLKQLEEYTEEESA